MQRVVSINLNGNAYQLEENGYNALFAYLDATEEQVQDSPGRAQTLADLERAVADKCQACLGPHKNVVTSAEIDRILLELGPIAGQPAAEPTPPPTATSSSTGGGHRRLYQIREGAMISGLCMGFSEFLHIDVTVIRVLVVLLALVTSGWGLLAYGVLMFVVPKVQTRAEAVSEPARTTHPHRWPWDDGWPWDRHGWPWDESRDARRDWRAERRAARAAYRQRSPFGTLSTIFFIMVGFFWLSFWTRGHFFFGWPFFWGFPHWIGIVFFFMMMRLVFMPFRMARWQRHGYGPYGSYDPYAHPHHAWVSMWNGLAWFMMMIFLAWAAYHFIPEVRGFHV